MTWEKEYGYSQAVKVGDTIYLSGQVSHDDKGNIVGAGDMDVQMHQAYANVKSVSPKGTGSKRFAVSWSRVGRSIP